MAERLSGDPLNTCDVSGTFWLDVDTPDDLQYACEALRRRELAAAVWRKNREAVILAHRRVGDVPLALRPVCGVSLIRRQLQVLRTNDWRQAVLIVDPQDRQRVESAIGDLTALGVKASYLTAPREADSPLKACLGGDRQRLTHCRGSLCAM